MPSRPLLIVLLLAVALVAASAVDGVAATPQQQCQTTKNKAAGKYAKCRQDAEAKLATNGDMAKYSATIAKCEAKLAQEWQKAIARAAKAGSACLDAPLVESDFRLVIDACTGNIATALGGGGLTDCTQDLATVLAGTAVASDVVSGKTFSSAAGLGVTGTMPDNGALTITPTTSPQAIPAGYHNGLGVVAGDADLVAANIKSGIDLFGVTGTFIGLGGELVKTGQTTSYGAGSDGDQQKGFVHSYTDNGDGTVTDNVTGLMWEKKSDDGSIHDKDNTYTWGLETPPYAMNGTMVTAFLAALNAGGGFAGHTDWRIPNRKELESITDIENVFPAVPAVFNTGCTGGCTVTTCSCTKTNYYWSSSTAQGAPGNAWRVYFYDGTMNPVGKSGSLYVRAVRGG
ncbi:MAG: hypothetical protein B6D46_08245 [Polyangiaceae bacterium UTPRO1]|jgi:hypothetical protein|nr:DUF1566 domain-containing protein [Myxococcales bacterium]OQY67084.1 MAG: hypothetical protein B6D46_08245 [Polyangiaceae bacterium UTPRO1]